MPVLLSEQPTMCRCGVLATIIKGVYQQGDGQQVCEQLQGKTSHVGVQSSSCQCVVTTATCRLFATEGPGTLRLAAG
jgi:hypothetical protein